MHQDADRLFRRYMQALGWLGDPGLFELVRTHLIKVPVENVSGLLANEPGLPSIDSFVEGIADKDLGGDAFTINGYFTELLRYLDYDVELLSGQADGEPFAHSLIRVVEDGVPYLVDVGLGAPLYEPIALSSLPLWVESGDWVYTLDHHRESNTFVLTTALCGRTSRTVVVGPTPRKIEDFTPTILRLSSADDPYLRHLRITRVFAASRIVSLEDATLMITHHNETTRRPLADLEALSSSVVDELQLHNLPIVEAVEALRSRGVDIFASSTSG